MHRQNHHHANWCCDLQPYQSVLGGFLDPLADKIMVTTVALALGQQGIVPPALVVRWRGGGGERTHFLLVLQSFDHITRIAFETEGGGERGRAGHKRGEGEGEEGRLGNVSGPHCSVPPRGSPLLPSVLLSPFLFHFLFVDAVCGGPPCLLVGSFACLSCACLLNG